MEAVRRAENTDWNADALRSHARRFDRQVFREQFQAFVAESLAAHATGTRFS
jgi:nicotinamide riboside kinase